MMVAHNEELLVTDEHTLCAAGNKNSKARHFWKEYEDILQSALALAAIDNENCHRIWFRCVAAGSRAKLAGADGHIMLPAPVIMARGCVSAIEEMDSVAEELADSSFKEKSVLARLSNHLLTLRTQYDFVVISCTVAMMMGGYEQKMVEDLCDMIDMADKSLRNGIVVAQNHTTLPDLEQMGAMLSGYLSDLPWYLKFFSKE